MSPAPSASSPADPADDPQAPPLRPLVEPPDGTPAVIDTVEVLSELIPAVADGQGPIAVDAERASGYRYGHRAFLVQIRREGTGTALIDPESLGGDLSALGGVVNSAEWVLHAASQDLPCLREVGLEPPSVFDTELAARLLGRQKVGLGALIAEEFGLELAKEHSAADWSTRPLPESWLRYAALDVELLLPLRQRLTEQLEAAGKLEWARQEFEAVLRARPVDKPDPWRRTSGVQSIRSARGLAAVRELWLTRDEVARETDRSPTRILPDSAIVAAASALPRTPEALRRLPGFVGRGAGRHLRRWFASVERARTAPAEALPPRRRPADPSTPPAPRSWRDKDPAAAVRLDTVRATVRERAEALEVPQENLLAPAVQRQLAWDGPPPSGTVAQRLAELGARPWQIEQLAGSLDEAIRPE